MHIHLLLYHADTLTSPFTNILAKIVRKPWRPCIKGLRSRNAQALARSSARCVCKGGRKGVRKGGCKNRPAF